MKRYWPVVLLLLQSPSVVLAESGTTTLSFGLPFTGTVLQSFGEADDTGGVMRGMLFAANPDEDVRAAADGVALYAGPFRSFGNLVIIDHGCGLHTTMAGMGRLSIANGQRVRLGEALGKARQAEEKREIYLEVRRDGVPVDPALVLPQKGSSSVRTIDCASIKSLPQLDSRTEKIPPEQSESAQKPRTAENDPPPQKPVKAKARTGSFPWPLQGKVITYFDKRIGGINIAVPEGTRVNAVESGIVIYSGDGLKDFGKTVLVRHEDGLVTVYGHLNELTVTRGQKVKRGEAIGKSGMSGAADQPQLHFEVRKNASPVDPEEYLAEQGL